MKALAFVSDEMYRAVADVAGEFENEQTGEITLLRSSPRGAFYGDLKPGRYRVTLSKDNFGSKISTVELGGDAVVHLRLLPERICGYMWPKWVRSGEKAEYRVHASEQYQITLWRYGWKKEFVRMISWVDEHGPGANRQTLPDGDFTRTGVGWNERGFPSPPKIVAPERSGLYYVWVKTPSGDSFSFPWVVAPAKPSAKIAVLASTNTWRRSRHWVTRRPSDFGALTDAERA